MEDRISMATKRQITLRFKDEYAKASKKDKGVILDRMCEDNARFFAHFRIPGLT